MTALVVLGVVGLVVAFLVGVALGLAANPSKQRRLPPEPLPASIGAQICGCGHGLEQHDPPAGSCHAKVRFEILAYGMTYSYVYERCKCRRYVESFPADQRRRWMDLDPQPQLGEGSG